MRFLSDKIASIFVPSVVLLSLLAFIVWFFVERDLAFALSIAACVLVISCPCALGLAVPLAIVCASMRAKKAEILIFDDSSSALDYATDLALRKALATLKDTTIFIVAQRSASLQSCDKIVVLDEGKMVGFDTHENLLKENEVYQDIYYSQFNKEGK